MFTSFLGFFQSGVTVSVEMPEMIDAGNEITVNVTIRKGKLTGSARFQQELPYGFTAVAINSANANFSFEDQKVRLNWVPSIPEGDEIVFSYKIIANERLTGQIDLKGRFSYIDNNELKSTDQQPKMLAIVPSLRVSPTMQVDVHEYAKIASIESITTMGGQAVALRQQPVWMNDEQVFLVTLLINKDEAQKFAKIEETVPAGYTAISVDSKEGIFSYSNQTAQYIWKDLPVDKYFTVSYKLIPEEGVSPNPVSMRIAGVFSYTINGGTFAIEIIERPEALASLNSMQVNNILRNVTVKTVEQQQQSTLIAQTNPSQSSSSSTTSSSTSSTTSSSSSSSSSSSTSSTSTTSSSTSSTTSSSTPSTSVAVNNNASDMLMPETGVYYRVQIAAGHQPINTQRYFRSYRLEYLVAKEMHEGWYKYSVGSFSEYKDARDYRVHLSNTTKINDAFVAAYNNGKRITVQDPLMALNQNWIR